MARESYQHRIERNLAAQAAVGLPASLPAARGHYEERLPAGYRKEAYKAANTVARVGGRVDSRGNATFSTVAGFDHAILDLARYSPNAKIFLNVDGFTIFHKGGITAGELVKITKQDYGGDFDRMASGEAKKQDKQSPKKDRKRTAEQERAKRQRRRDRIRRAELS